jgi:hypothetical protein
MRMFDPHSVTQFTEFSWLVMRIITPALMLIVPFMIWRILRWTYGTYREMAGLNSKLEKLIGLLEAGEAPAGRQDHAAEIPQGSAPVVPATGEERKEEPVPPELSQEEIEERNPAPPEAEPEEQQESSLPTDVGREGAASYPAAEESPAEEEKEAGTPPVRPEATPLPQDPTRPGVSLARCGTCGHKLAYKRALSGKQVRCPSCKTPLRLP